MNKLVELHPPQKKYRQSPYLFCIIRLWILILNFEGSQGQCFDEQVLIDHVAPYLSLLLACALFGFLLVLHGHLLSLTHISRFKKAT